jgi:hypothetical protein
MKTFYLMLSLLMISEFLNAQSITNDAVVAAVKMNVLYRGLDNPIEIAVPGVKSDRVDAAISNGTIKKMAYGWEVEPGEQPVSIISVFVDKKKVTEKTFRVKNVPIPVAVFVGKNEGEILREMALSNQVIEVELKDFLWDLRFNIESFKLDYINNGFVAELTATGNKLTKEMINAISSIKSGNKIIFKDIKAVGPDGKTRELNPIVLTIK